MFCLFIIIIYFEPNDTHFRAVGDAAHVQAVMKMSNLSAIFHTFKASKFSFTRLFKIRFVLFTLYI